MCVSLVLESQVVKLLDRFDNFSYLLNGLAEVEVDRELY